MFSRKGAGPFLLIPNQWDGSVQHFYHFLLGYLMPITDFVSRKSPKHIYVRDCGPMNPWFEPLKSLTEVTVISPGSALHAFTSKQMTSRILPSWDNPETFQYRRLERFAHIFMETAAPNSASREPVEITVIDRGSADPFYGTAESETAGAGSDRRSIPNIKGLADRLTGLANVEVVDFASQVPRDQIAHIDSTSVLIGQHGAGLTNMIWGKRGLQVIEIAPPLKPHVQQIFEKLADTLGHSYSRLQQADSHSPIDVESVIRHIKY